ncbi:hypothetical protein CXG81DRAFT_26563 [Caulochytrium protostelioides]|uniref:Mss4-like protein n=1 Tax=Caulochytrium protostelioides TaxID=1555241 RepID=A0A4P9X6C6_9FUNG|nr:hypothetical protein CXG81DRAFT_26563 [Caulochytrium protostelioides]|eukprot:RKP00737.1 hypothetical protein CXG81DRAFT_26563 [Caulochytrium protostelioides]
MADAVLDPMALDAGARCTADVRCLKCNLLIFSSGIGTLHVATAAELETSFPAASASATAAGAQPTPQRYWELTDKYQFDNVTVSRAAHASAETPAGQRPRRYLACADCEADVIGYVREAAASAAAAQPVDGPNAPGGETYYVATDRVRYTASKRAITPA